MHPNKPSVCLLTAQVKLVLTAEQKDALLQTLCAANAACDFISAWAWANRSFKQYDLHHGTYYDVRARFGLSSQMAVRAVSKVADAYKRDKATQRAFRPTGSIAYDSRVVRFLPEKGVVSLWTVGGRVTVPFLCGDHHLALLATQKGEADLALIDGEFYLFPTCEVVGPEAAAPNGCLGVDLGIVLLATDSDGDAYSGEPTRAVRRRYRRLRRNLQSVGTRSAKRHLKHSRRRESRFCRWVNHNISRRLVDKAKRLGKALVLETLTGIRERGNGLGREMRWQLGSWGFHQLQTLIAYKARKEGVPVVFVDAAYSSRTCSRCGFCDKANRKSQACFLCQSCGFQANADQNAACVLEGRGLEARGAVTRPTVAVLAPSV